MKQTNRAAIIALCWGSLFVARRHFGVYKNVVLRLPNSSPNSYFSPAVFGVAITINFKYIFELKFLFKRKNNNKK